MLTTNAFLSTSTASRRRLGTRARFTARPARTTHRSPEATALLTTAPAETTFAA